jgi:rhomboid protease GluP
VAGRTTSQSNQTGRRRSGRRFEWPVATCALAAASLLAWFAVAWSYQLPPFGTQNSALLLRSGAVNGETLGAGGWWRILTSQFLHVHFPHLIFNMAALLLLGRASEREFGPWRLLALYFFSGVVGQLLGVAAAPLLVSSGASQAVMGLAGGALVARLRRPRGGARGLIVPLAFVGVQCALDLFVSGGIKAGHWGGFCAGVLVACVMWRRAAGD